MAQNQYQYLARRNPDVDSLLASSRKALVFVEESEVNAAAKEVLNSEVLYKLYNSRDQRDKAAFISAWFHAFDIFSRYMTYTEDEQYVTLAYLLFSVLMDIFSGI